VCACIDDAITLQPGERRMVPSGFAIALPDGYEAQLRARSGLSIKHGITMINGIGTIDADYRGEVGVLLVNLGQEAFEITPGMRIAQLVVARYERIDWSEVATLEATERGAGGFGSTGK
jgi:deoxyuridine 5''-triphosphate nucleotidohydrolase (dut)